MQANNFHLFLTAFLHPFFCELLTIKKRMVDIKDLDLGLTKEREYAEFLIAAKNIDMDSYRFIDDHRTRIQTYLNFQKVLPLITEVARTLAYARRRYPTELCLRAIKNDTYPGHVHCVHIGDGDEMDEYGSYVIDCECIQIPSIKSQRMSHTSDEMLFGNDASPGYIVIPSEYGMFRMVHDTSNRPVQKIMESRDLYDPRSFLDTVHKPAHGSISSENAYFPPRNQRLFKQVHYWSYFVRSIGEKGPISKESEYIRGIKKAIYRYDREMCYGSTTALTALMNGKREMKRIEYKNIDNVNKNRLNEQYNGSSDDMDEDGLSEYDSESADDMDEGSLSEYDSESSIWSLGAIRHYDHYPTKAEKDYNEHIKIPPMMPSRFKLKAKRMKMNEHTLKPLRLSLKARKMQEHILKKHVIKHASKRSIKIDF